MGARVYLASIGRFLQVDPIEGGTPNNYVYPPDPVGDFDLDGNMSTAAKWGVGILGAAGVAAACVFGGCEALAGSVIVVRTVAVAGPVLAKVTAWTPRVLNRVAAWRPRVGQALRTTVDSVLRKQFTGHALSRIAQRGGSIIHALVAKYFGRPLGPVKDTSGKWSYNFATKYTRIAINASGRIVTYIRFTKKWWRF